MKQLFKTRNLPSLLIIMLALQVPPLVGQTDESVQASREGEWGAVRASWQSPLFHAVVDEDRDTLERLLKSGQNVNVSDSGGNTPLHYAALRADFGAVNLLLLHGARTDAADRMGRTPLHAAVLATTQDEAAIEGVVQTLLDAGANPNPANTISVLVVAEAKGLNNTAQTLRSRGAVHGTSEMEATMVRKIPATRELAVGIKNIIAQLHAGQISKDDAIPMTQALVEKYAAELQRLGLTMSDQEKQMILNAQREGLERFAEGGEPSAKQ